MSNIISEFMVALGYKTDAAGEKKMAESFRGMAVHAQKLGAAMMNMAVSAITAITQTAGEMEKLYYSSQRIGASAENIRGFGDAISQMGGSADSAVQSLESVARKMRESPGTEGLLQGLGVATRDANGQMRDRVEVMQDLAKSMKGMDYSKANAYAGALGIDENTLMAMRDGKLNENMEKYTSLRKKMGLSDDTAESGKEFMQQSRDVTITLKAAAEVILMTAGKALIPVLRIINTGLQNAIQWFSGLNPQLKGFLAAGLKIATLVLFFGGLFAAISKLAMVIPMLKGLIMVIRAMSAAFLMSPIGIILALAAGIALLYDDYQTWKSGGESLIDWSKWSKGIDSAIQGMKDVMDWLKKLGQSAIDFGKGRFDKVVDFTTNLVTTETPETKPAAPQIPITPDSKKPAVLPNAKLPTDAASLAAWANQQNLPEPSPNVAATVMKTINKSATNTVAAVVQKVDSEIRNGLAQFMAAVSSGEGGYNSVNRGLVRGKNLGSFETDLSQMTINQVLKANELKPGNPRRMNAVGRYQIVAENMKERVKSMGLTGNEKLTPQMQDKLFMDILKTKRPDIYNYAMGKSNNLTAALIAAAQEWASIGVPIAMKGRNRWLKAGESFYAGDGGNKAHPQSLGKIKAALENMRRMNAPTKGNPYLEQKNQASPVANMTINQKTDIHVSGSADPRATALSVGREQQAVNTQLARNALGAIT